MSCTFPGVFWLKNSQELGQEAGEGSSIKVMFDDVCVACVAFVACARCNVTRRVKDAEASSVEEMDAHLLLRAWIFVLSGPGVSYLNGTRGWQTSPFTEQVYFPISAEG
jgi:hypothetical protein